MVVRDAISWDVCGDCLCVRERSDPLVIVEHLRGGVRNMSCALSENRHSSGMSPALPIDCEDVEDSEESSFLSSAFEGNDRIQVLLSFT